MRYLIEKVYDLLIYTISFTLVFGVILFYVHVEQKVYVKETTAKFVERIKYEGYITKDAYERYMEQVSVAPYRIYIRHIVYSTDVDGRKLESPYTEYNILQTLYDTGKDYRMHKGDDITVIVAEMNPSPFFIFMQMVTNTPAMPSVVTSQGGMVLNESY